MTISPNQRNGVARAFSQETAKAVGGELARQRPGTPPLKHPPGSLVSKAFSLARAILSGKEDDALAAERLERCLHSDVRCPTCGVWAEWDEELLRWQCPDGCGWQLVRDQALAEAGACPYLTERDGKGWCGACGCPSNDMSELGNKVQYRDVICPRDIWPAEWPRTESDEHEAE